MEVGHLRIVVALLHCADFLWGIVFVVTNDGVGIADEGFSLLDTGRGNINFFSSINLLYYVCIALLECTQ